MKQTLSLLIAIVLTLSFTACKKSSNSAPATETKTDLLTKGAWTWESNGADLNMDTVLTGSENSTLACNTDNTYTFAADGSYVYNTGAIKCNTEATIQTGNWNFQINETQINLSSNLWSVKSITNNRLVLCNYGPASISIWTFKR